MFPICELANAARDGASLVDLDAIAAQTRYRQKPFSVKIKKISDREIILEIMNETDAAALGQSCVLYREEVCIGGGIIS